MEKIISTFTKIKYVLLHGSYPFIDEVLLLAKYYNNVYLDLAWIFLVDGVKSLELMERIFELLPINKIFVFGGDHVFIENAVGPLYKVKECITKVLFRKIENKQIDFNEAINIAEKLLNQNASDLFEK